MSAFKIDSEVVKNSVEKLRKLLDECEELYNKVMPESSVDKGSTHNELYELCENFKTTCRYFGELINNSILFLGGASEMFDTSDEESAEAITDTTTPPINSGNIESEGGNNTESGSVFQTKVLELSSKEGFKEGQTGPTGYVEYYTTTNGVTVPIGGSSCFAMAHMMQAEIIGQRGDRIYTSNTADIKVGDVIHYYGDGADAEFGHWVFVTDINDGILTVAEGNYGGGYVRYGRNINLYNISLVEIDRVNDFNY